MTSLLTPSHDQVDHELRHRRPVALVAGAGGVAAALGPLLVCLAVAVVGWFLTDAGAHGAPRDALRVGGLAWLMAHGSGVVVEGTRVGVVPLALTVLCAWSVWRVGHRVGDSVSGHGPDADRIADGERDWTVPVATGLFTAGYLATALVALRTAGTDATAPDGGRVLLWGLLMGGLVAGPAIAVGSGRAAIWVPRVPAMLRGSLTLAARLLVAWAAVCAAVLVVSLVVDLGTAVNIFAQLHTDAGDTMLLGLAGAAVLPNAVVFAGSYLLGPGFSVGAGTLVAPSSVVVGPLPMFPLLAALPDTGPTPGWVLALLGLGPATAVVVTLRTVRTRRWEVGGVRGCLGGALAGVAFALLAAVSGGPAGPGRMQQVGPPALEVLLHAVTAFGLGGLMAGLVATWWTRRH